MTMNQTMLAIFEANPEAFGGNINILRAGASIRIPSADEIFQINRDDALAEAQRQHAEWSGGTVAAVTDTSTRPSLTLVPPDDDFADEGETLAPEPEPEPYLEPEPFVDDELSPREQEILDRIDELEAADVPEQQSLIEVRDNELAQLRDELARIRGEVIEPALDDSLADSIDDVADETDAIGADDAVADAAADAEPADTTRPDQIIQTSPRSQPSLVDRIIEYATGIYGMIAGAVILVVALLVWFMKRGRSDDDIEEWQPLDKDEMAAEISATESLRAPSPDESIVVVEQTHKRTL